ncbi:MAG: phospholipid carrier-dependent glycosyltransferase [Patescibacteria group bacterium]
MPSLRKFPVHIIVLLLLFIAQGVLFAILFPAYQGPDEQIHYGTIQYQAEPKEKDWPLQEPTQIQLFGDVRTYKLSEETIQSAYLLQFDDLRWQKENTEYFSQTSTGIHEQAIAQNEWKRYIDTTSHNASGTKSFYYEVGGWIEKTLSSTSFFTRFLSQRLLSVFLGALVVLFTYLVAKKAGLSLFESILIATLVAFQPMFVFLSSVVNIDVALILSFTIFTYATIWLLKDGPKIPPLCILFFATVLGLYSKGPGIVLAVTAVLLIVFFVVQYWRKKDEKFFWKLFIGVTAFIILASLITPKSYIASITHLTTNSKFSSPAESLVAYGKETLDKSAFMRTHTSYWGYFGWLDTKISNTVLTFIWDIQAIALLGLILFLITKTPPEYLPKKRFVVFFIIIILLLQLAIRFFDWRVFDATRQILIGTPGRYFLPTLVPHILLIITGLGFFTKNKHQFHILLKALTLGMILLLLYAVINVIIPRYYL